MTTETEERILSKVVQGKLFTIDLLSASGLLRIAFDGRVIATACKVFPIEAGKGQYRNAPKDAAYAFARDDHKGVGTLNKEEGGRVYLAQQAAIMRAQSEADMAMVPEFRAALKQYGTSDQAHQAEDVRACDVLRAHGC